MKSLYPNHIFITGVSSGIGKATLEALCLKTNSKILAAIRGGAERARSSGFHPIVETAHKEGRLQWISVELTDPSSRLAVPSVVQSFLASRIDIMIHNAGSGLMGPALYHTESELRHQFDVNFFGTVELNRLVFPFLTKPGGKIICVTSLMGLYSLPFYSAYSASKHALEAYFESLYYEIKPSGMQVCIVEPGGIQTAFMSKTSFGNGQVAHHDPIKPVADWFQSFYSSKTSSLTTPVARVADRMLSLCSKPKLPQRVLIGKDAWAFHLYSKFLPLIFRIKLVETILSLVRKSRSRSSRESLVP